MMDLQKMSVELWKFFHTTCLCIEDIIFLENFNIFDKRLYSFCFWGSETLIYSFY